MPRKPTLSFARGIHGSGAIIAYVKLIPGVTQPQMITKNTIVSAKILTLQRRPELEDPLGLGHWRVHSIGQPASVEDLPPKGHRNL